MSEKKPDWISMKPAEMEKIVVDLGKAGESPSKIGIILRDKHGIPKSKLLGKKVSQIMIEANIPITSEKEKIQSEVKKLEVHIAKNKHDYTSKKSLAKKMWNIARINKKS